MKIGERDFTKDEFRVYLSENFEEIFEDDVRKKWLKMYCVLVSDEDWQSQLFFEDELERHGEVLRFSPKLKMEAPTSEEDTSAADRDESEETGQPEEPESREPETYWVVPHCKGLIVLYTTASNEKYQSDLGERIDRTCGVTRMWMRQDLYNTFWRGIMEDTEGFVYYFKSTRRPYEDTPCRIRPQYKRRLNYSGLDATQTLEELKESYGANPDVVYLETQEGIKLHIRNDGLYAVQKPSKEAMDLFYKYLDKVKPNILAMSNVSKALRFEILRDASDRKVVSIDAGLISLKDREIDATIVERLRESISNFSLIDAHMETGSIGFTATVVDVNKGSVFNITASESRIVVVPKFNYTFESFFSFYREVVESIDEHADFSLLSSS
jgi:hypothetical protein